MVYTVSLFICFKTSSYLVYYLLLKISCMLERDRSVFRMVKSCLNILAGGTNVQNS